MTSTSTSAEFDFAGFRRSLHRWYREYGRHSLPWRLTRDPYAVLVSEVMLQQTQVERVLPYYREWLSRWPDWGALAGTSPAEVIRAWRGLGYNRRALHLHRLAVRVTEDFHGRLPLEPKQLKALPGIGAYTASALQSFALEARVTVADTNIARVVARALLGAADQKEVQPKVLGAALSGLLPARGARDHNLALMDLGAMVCAARIPHCGDCPVRRHCRWRADGYPAREILAAPTAKFETTARFARGRIIDALREAPASTEELASMLPERHRARTPEYLRALARDGMIEGAGGVWALPGMDRVYTPNR